MSQADIDKALASKDFGQRYRTEAPLRGRKDGQPVLSYEYSLSGSEPRSSSISPKKDTAFNLDGKVGALDYTDPLTKETGVDNVAARIIGCIDRTRGTLDAPVGNTMLRWQHIIEGSHGC